MGVLEGGCRMKVAGCRMAVVLEWKREDGNLREEVCKVG